MQEGRLLVSQKQTGMINKVNLSFRLLFCYPVKDGLKFQLEREFVFEWSLVFKRYFAAS